MNSEASIPNESLRRARILKGWSQAELAEQVGTSFEMVSRWERGITVPSPRYRKRLCEVLGQTAEELGLVHILKNPLNPPSSPFVVLASSHTDAEKAIVSNLKMALQKRGIALWSSRQIVKQSNGNASSLLREAIHDTLAIFVILSPQSHSSRHVRDSFEIARIYQRPVYGIWIEGEDLEQCLPEGRVELAVLIDVREKDNVATLEAIVTAFEQVKFSSLDTSGVAQASVPDTSIAVPFMVLPAKIPTSMKQSEPLEGLPFHRARRPGRFRAGAPGNPQLPARTLYCFLHHRRVVVR